MKQSDHGADDIPMRLRYVPRHENADTPLPTDQETLQAMRDEIEMLMQMQIDDRHVPDLPFLAPSEIPDEVVGIVVLASGVPLRAGDRAQLNRDGTAMGFLVCQTDRGYVAMLRSEAQIRATPVNGAFAEILSRRDLL